MNLLSLKGELQNAKAARPQPTAKKHHMRRVMLTGTAVLILGAATLIGVHQWNRYKERAEYLQSNPYSIEALFERSPNEKELYSKANFYSLEIDSLARSLMNRVTQRKTPVLFTYPQLQSEDEWGFTRREAEHVLSQFFLGGPRNPLDLSEADHGNLKQLFEKAPNDAILLFYLWALRQKELRLERQGITLPANPSSLQLDLNATVLYLKAHRVFGEVYERARRDKDESDAYLRDLHVPLPASGSDENLGEPYKSANLMRPSIFQQLRHCMLGNEGNPPDLAQQAYDSLSVNLINIEQLIDLLSNQYARKNE